MNMFLCGLQYIPGYSHAFASFLWRTLVLPVGNYGFEVYTWSDDLVHEFMQHHVAGWRKVLKVGCRAPASAVACMINLHVCSISWRAQRVALMIRMLNSPPDSLSQVALVILRELQAAWFTAAYSDLKLVFPTLRLSVVDGLHGPRIISTAWWSDEGEWCSAHACNLPRDCLGHFTRMPLARGVVDDEIKAVRIHARICAKSLRTKLQRGEDTERFYDVINKAQESQSSKAAVLACKLCSPGPPLHVGLTWVRHLSHRAAIASFIAGDWFLARYAHNYFGRDFIPRAWQDEGFCREQVCLHCWHERQELHLEDESHVMLVCPLYDTARIELTSNLSANVTRAFAMGSFLAPLSSQVSNDWVVFGRFAARVRQMRRKLRWTFQRRTAVLQNRGFGPRKKVWQDSGKFVCRHG
eukprot:1642956-Karenia_brevis.AAC.1